MSKLRLINTQSGSESPLSAMSVWTAENSCLIFPQNHELCPFFVIFARQTGLRRTDCLSSSRYSSRVFLRSRNEQSGLQRARTRTVGDHKPNALRTKLDFSSFPEVFRIAHVFSSLCNRQRQQSSDRTEKNWRDRVTLWSPITPLRSLWRPVMKACRLGVGSGPRREEHGAPADFLIEFASSSLETQP